MIPNLNSYTTRFVSAIYQPNGESLLTIPAGEKGTYRLAQLDDYHSLARKDFLWQEPLTVSLQARCSAIDHTGTWGFGLWNDPFTASIGLGGTSRRLPTLPNCAWFFYASAPNYLSIYDHIPATGFLASTFQSPLIPAAFLSPGLLLLPLIRIPPAARLMRRVLRYWIHQDACQLHLNVNDWHEYRLQWYSSSVSFMIDGQKAFETSITPNGRLGFVLWIDNQYAAFLPNGHLSFGTLANLNANYLQVNRLSISQS